MANRDPDELTRLAKEMNAREAGMPGTERRTLAAPPGLVRSPRNGALMVPGVKGKRSLTEQKQIDRVRRGSRRLTLKMLRMFDNYVKALDASNPTAARDETLQFIWKEVVPYAVQKLPTMSEQRLSMELGEGGGQPVFAVIQVTPPAKQERIPEAEYQELPNE